MKQWQGIERDAAAVDNGSCLQAVNPRFYIEGELQRRRGLTKVASGSAVRTIAAFWSPTAGRQMLVQTTAGTITGAAAS